MKTNYIYLLIFSFLILILIIITLLGIDKYIIAFTITTSLIAGMLLPIISGISKNPNQPLLWLKSQLFIRETMVRFTFAYLFRIKHKGKYLLVYGKKLGKYQPVGGVYKWYSKPPFELTDDEMLPVDETSKDDYRGHIKGKELVKFLNYFNSKKEREITQHREFYEELIKTGILSENIFDISSLVYKYYGTNIAKVSNNYQGKPELKMLEVYELVLNDLQKDEIEELYTKEFEDESFLWVNKDEIKNLQKIVGSDSIKAIGNQTKYII